MGIGCRARSSGGTRRALPARAQGEDKGPIGDLEGLRDVLLDEEHRDVHDGKTVGSGTGAELLRDAKVREAYLSV